MSTTLTRGPNPGALYATTSPDMMSATLRGLRVPGAALQAASNTAASRAETTFKLVGCMIKHSCRIRIEAGCGAQRIARAPLTQIAVCLKHDITMSARRPRLHGGPAPEF